MRPTSFWESYWQSFYARRLYQEVYQHWGRRIWAYLALLAALTSLSVLVEPVNSLSLLRHESQKLIQQLPTLSFHQGQLSIDQASPYSLYSDDHRRLMVFDTQASPEGLQAYKPLLFAFGADGFYIYSIGNTVDKYYKAYSDYRFLTKDLRLTPKQSMSYLQDLFFLIQIVLYLLALISTFIKYCFMAVCLALVNMAIAIVHQLKLSKRGAFRLAALALTPSALLQFLTVLLGFHTPVWGPLLGIFLSFCYSVFAVLSIKKLGLPSVSHKEA